jgi:hypothetical protein
MASENNFANQLSSIFASSNQANDEMQQQLEAEMEGEVIDASATSAGNDTDPRKFSYVADGPTLYGEHADLLTWDPDQKQFVAVSEEAQKALEQMGEKANIFQAIPGSHLAQQLSWNNGRARTSASSIAKLASGPSKIESVGSSPITAFVKPDAVNSEGQKQPEAALDAPDTPDAPESAEEKLAKKEQENEELKKQLKGKQREPNDLADTLGSLINAAILGGGKLAKDSVTGCSELIKKWKSDRETLAKSIHDNAAEQVQQRQEKKPGMGLEDLKDKGEVESSVKGIDPADLQKNAESMREDTKQFKQEFDQQRDQFKGSLNKNLETIFQAMGYGDPTKDKAASLADFERDLKELPELKQKKVTAAIEAIKGDSESFRSYIEEKSESPEAAKADIEDQEAFAKSASEIKDDPTKEANKKYQDMMDKIGLGGVSIKESLGGIFKALGNVVGRVVERATMIKGNISKAVDMNQGSSNQQSERLG